jgi:hypothetical protein
MSTGLNILDELVALRGVIDGVIYQVVEICLSEWSASWAEIGAVTGMTKQSAQERFGRLGRGRNPGGQPAGLR